MPLKTFNAQESVNYPTYLVVIWKDKTSIGLGSKISEQIFISYDISPFWISHSRELKNWFWTMSCIITLFHLTLYWFLPSVRRWAVLDSSWLHVIWSMLLDPNNLVIVSTKSNQECSQNLLPKRVILAKNVHCVLQFLCHLPSNVHELQANIKTRFSASIIISVCPHSPLTPLLSYCRQPFCLNIHVPILFSLFQPDRLKTTEWKELMSLCILHHASNSQCCSFTNACIHL